jgi:predicted PurR-regulated permease PerM
MEKTQYFLTRYFIGLLGELVSMMTMITIALLILGIDNALTIGFIAGLMNIVPYLGPVIGAIFGVIIAVVTVLSQGLYDYVLLTALEVIAVIVGANLVDNLFLQPLIYSSSVKAHPVEIFLVIIMAGSIAGIPGMILAIPGYTMIRVIAKEFLGGFRFVQDWTKNI